MLKMSADTILVVVYGISDVIAEQNKDNKSYIYNAPGVLPHQLVHITPHNFSVHMQHHQESLEYTFSTKKIKNIGLQNKALCNAYYLQYKLRISIYSFDNGIARMLGTDSTTRTWYWRGS